MASKLPEQQVVFGETSAGQMTNVNESIIPANSVQLGMNVDFDEEIGSAVGRPGTSIVGSQLVNNNTILGLSNFRDTDSTAHGLLAAVNASGDGSSVVFDVDASPATIVTGLTANARMRFLTFLDSILMINGNDEERSWNGATVVTTGGVFDLANIPSSNTVDVVEEFLDQVYVAGDTAQPDRLYFSSTPSSGSVSWTSGNGNLDVEPEDGGGGITALSKVPGYLLVFKERSMKRFNQQSAFPESLVNIGAPEQESVVKGGGLCGFYSASSRKTRGFYITDGGRPIPISHNRARNIKKWVDAIPQAYDANVSGIGTETYFLWSIGDVTVDGIAHTNVVVKWNRVLDQWSVRSYPSEFRVFAHYVAASGLTSITENEHVIVGGDDDGNILVIDNENDGSPILTDHPSATPIRFDLISQVENFGTFFKKEITERFVVDSQDAEGLNIAVRSDFGNWVTVGQIQKKGIQEIKLHKTLTANKFEFRIVGHRIGFRPIIKSLFIPHIISIDVI